jgi:hypothetical protein
MEVEDLSWALVTTWFGILVAALLTLIPLTHHSRRMLADVHVYAFKSFAVLALIIPCFRPSGLSSLRKRGWWICITVTALVAINAIATR